MASGDDKRAAAAAHAGLNGAAAQPVNLPTLRGVCLHALIVNRRFLGDVGDIDGTSVRDIVRHCSAQEMANIEDCTREGVSQRDLSWYTWHLWHRHYLRELGMPPADMEIIPLEGEPPGDYVPPITDAPEGDWRHMMEQRQREMEEKAARLSGRLRGLYQAEQKLRDSRKVEVCAIKPPSRRRGPNAPSGTTFIAGSSTKGKLLKGIGLASSQARSIKSYAPPSGPSSAKGGQAWGRSNTSNNSSNNSNSRNSQAPRPTKAAPGVPRTMGLLFPPGSTSSAGGSSTGASGAGGAAAGVGARGGAAGGSGGGSAGEGAAGALGRQGAQQQQQQQQQQRLQAQGPQGGLQGQGPQGRTGGGGDQGYGNANGRMGGTSGADTGGGSTMRGDRVFVGSASVVQPGHSPGVAKPPVSPPNPGARKPLPVGFLPSQPRQRAEASGDGGGGARNGRGGSNGVGPKPGEGARTGHAEAVPSARQKLVELVASRKRDQELRVAEEGAAAGARGAQGSQGAGLKRGAEGAGKAAGAGSEGVEEDGAATKKPRLTTGDGGRRALIHAMMTGTEGKAAAAAGRGGTGGGAKAGAGAGKQGRPPAASSVLQPLGLDDL